MLNSTLDFTKIISHMVERNTYRDKFYENYIINNIFYICDNIKFFSTYEFKNRVKNFIVKSLLTKSSEKLTFVIGNNKLKKLQIMIL